MSAEKIEAKVEKEAPVAAKSGKSGGIFLFVTAIVMVLLVVAVIMSFLNNQKLHKQVVELERKVTVLEKSDGEVGKRVLALEDEMVVMGLKRQLRKLGSSLKNLLEIDRILPGNDQVKQGVDALAALLDGEKKKLEEEIAGKGTRHFQASRPQLPCYQKENCPCPQAMVIMHPPLEKPCLAPAPSPGSHAAPAAAAVPAHGAHPAPVAAAPTAPADADSWWTKFINFRIFGN